MPTGYTAGVGDGSITSFAEYAKNCARAFGALIHLRDEPNAEFPESIQPSSYHADRLSEALNEFKIFESLPTEELYAQFEQNKKDQIKSAIDAINEKKNIRLRYEKMLAIAKQFIPPTTQHIEYSKFIVDQIEKSISFDCDDKYSIESLTNAENLTYEEWYNKKIENFKWSIEYHTRNSQEENQRAINKTVWIQELLNEVNRIENAL